MNVLILHHEDISDLLCISALLNRFSKDNFEVMLATDDSCIALARFMKCKVVSIHKIQEEPFDLAVNVSPLAITSNALQNIKAITKLGYYVQNDIVSFLNVGAEKHYMAKYATRNTSANLLQLTFGLAGITWEGEGYGVKYYPRNKTQKKLTGICIKNPRLREFVMENLSLSMTKLWYVPFKKNPLKQIDEINRCSQIITDEQSIAHMSLAFRKEVEFITPCELPYRIEMFKSGNIFVFDI